MIAIEPLRLNLSWHHRNLFLNILDLILKNYRSVEISKAHIIVGAALG